MDKEKLKPILSFIRTTLLWFLVFYLGMQWWQGRNEEPNTTQSIENTSWTLKPFQNSITLGNEIIYTLQKGNTNINIANFCEQNTKPRLVTPRGTQMVDVLENTSCQDLQKLFKDVNTTEKTAQISFSALQNTTLNQKGEYVLEIPLENQTTITSTPLTLKEPGAFRLFFRNLLSKPIFNALVWLTNALPGKNFGLGVILLTLFVRFLLFFPSLKALKSQQKMQAIQPKIKELQAKYKDNQQEMAQKLMALYKEHKVNPISGMLPMFLQLPVFLALYYTLQDGLAPHLYAYLYEPLQNISFEDFNAMFLGLNTTTKNIFPLPFLVAGAQFLAFSSGMAQNAGGNEQMAQMQKIMKWGLPIMIGVFTATLPAAVGIYWLISTLFGWGQQLWIKRNKTT